MSQEIKKKKKIYIYIYIYIESLPGFQHIQFCIYTEYVPNEKTQIPC